MEPFFLDLLLRGGVLCLGAAVVLVLLARAAAAYRHLVCATALIGLCLVPLVQRQLPSLALLSPPPTPRLAPVPVPVPVRASLAVPASPRRAPAPRPVPALPPVRVPYRPHPLLILWAAGAALLLLRLVLALRGLRVLVRDSQPVVLAGAPVRVSSRVTTPLTWGTRHPVILVPASLQAAEPALARSAVRHEQAHLARADWLWHLLAELVCAALWFQPGAWWLRRRLRIESERACDDRVLLSGIAPVDYASHLLALVRAGRAPQVAPGMTAVESMESRLRHLLDPKRARRSRRLPLALTALLGLTLVPLAALRVAARTGAPLVSRRPMPPRTRPSLALPAPRTARVRLAPPVQAPALPRLASPATAPLAVPPPPLAPQNLPTVETPRAPRNLSVPLQSVVWGKPIGGLEPGLWLLSGDRVPLNSRISYRVLVRNTTDKPITFLTRLLQYDGYEPPSLVPAPDLVVREESAPSALPVTKGAPRRYSLDPAYLVTLVPGEAVLVPGQGGLDTLGLVVGADDGSASPRVLSVTAGMHWLVQPLLLYPLPRPDKTGFGELMGLYEITKVGPDGTARTIAADRVVAPAGGTVVVARYQLEVGTRNAEAPRSARVALWGNADRGLQCGLRPLHPESSVRIGETLEVELLWRNTAATPLHLPLPRETDLSPRLQSAQGRSLSPRFGVQLRLLPGWINLAPAEVRSLGILRVALVVEGTPPPQALGEAVQFVVTPGTYRLSATGGVSAPGGPDATSGTFVFTIAGEAVH